MNSLKDIGEFGLIERIRHKLRPGTSVVKGIGDDAAVIKLGRDKYLLLTCDMLVEDVHFSLTRATPYQIGHKALASSISDIASMGGVPKEALISLGISPGRSVKFTDQLFNGLRKLAAEFKISLVGGDITRSKKLVINICLTGRVEKKNLLLRSGARVNDAILVTGRLGGAGRGKHLRFRPRLKEARFLVNKFKINSMIDISDGLVQDLGQITKESNLGAEIYQRDIPVSARSSFKSALEDGEDFELLFTMPKNEARRLLKNYPRIYNTPVKMIGQIIKQKEIFLIDLSGIRRKLDLKGWRHF